MGKKKKNENVEELVDEIVEEQVDEVEEELPQPAANRRGRAPDAPRSNEHHRRRQMVEAQKESTDDLAPHVYPVEEVVRSSANPRFDNTDGAQQGSRRTKIWKRRQSEGLGVCRRKIIGADGVDTGATTSSLE